MNRQLFERKYSMIAEATRLEDLMPSYKAVMRKLGMIIRNKVRCQADEKRLAYFLFCCNNTFEVLIEAVGDQIEVAELYVEILTKHWNDYSHNFYRNEYAPALEMIHTIKVDEITREQWERLNPYYASEYADDDIYGKKLTGILKDFMDHVDRDCADEFFVEEKKLKRLVRARNGKRACGVDIMPPPVEIAQNLNIINRWNPPEKRYSYLAEETDGTDPDEVCLEEKRARTGDEFTLVDFRVRAEARNKKLLNLDYEGVMDSDIEKDVNGALEKIVNADIAEINREGQKHSLSELEQAIRSTIGKDEPQLKKLANLYAGRKLLSTLCRVIFVPLDNDEDNDQNLKDKCYKSFHVLAEFLEEQGFAGVIFPSTRMILKGKKGLNVVLFDPDDVEPLNYTLRYKTKS